MQELEGYAANDIYWFILSEAAEMESQKFLIACEVSVVQLEVMHDMWMHQFQQNISFENMKIWSCTKPNPVRSDFARF